MKQTRRTYNIETKMAIVDLYNQGKSTTEIANLTNIHRTVIYKWINIHKKHTALSENERIKDLEKKIMQLELANKELNIELEIFRSCQIEFEQKMQVIEKFKHQYSVSKMCKAFNTNTKRYYRWLSSRRNNEERTE
ncbi:hypothetical protein JM47_03000 [Ureaplasma diversum]|uniref:Transposase n=1 Tax=Ureaplasma diversum TaxID=42094 RepID=A0A0C5RM72_9BACT|nr:transposase [Ureaplasma diversum]AJQ45512.1 hypothetical protein JM47_03000 [Ureaplasma diversum]